jgi:WD40 repeat protein
MYSGVNRELTMPVESRSLKELFLAALAVAPPERGAWLERECGQDVELRQRVELMLAAHDTPQSLLDRLAPAAGPPEGATGALAGPLAGPPSTPAGEKVGDLVAGRYKLLQQIGEGGMGTVWMAEQTEPIQRRVALKVVKEGMDSRQVLARFEAERQALALMEHPNIARVFDGGRTPSGRPYFVMELVKGQPITKYCDEKRLGVRERLDLFGEVCRAVQHAHQKGIIHRDLKPSNVLVAPYDGKPVVKVIDFGVAKATGQRLTDATLFTSFGAVVGTPEYMSPEQAETNNQDIDTRSDIYSLGVLLYELLTGSTPLTKKRVKEAALLEVLRVIREEEPPKPSTRLSSTEELPSVAAQRQTEPAKLTKLVRGELDWIVMKALEKDRNRRYETANGLAMDLQRYLTDEPVLACPASVGYRLRKFARRNKAVLVTTLVVAASLLLAVVVLALSAVRIKGERDEKITALEQTEKERDAKVAALEEAEKANDAATLRLYRSLVQQARASRRSRGMGQRFDSLDILDEATQLARQFRLPEKDFLELRNDVIACLALPDLRVAKEWPGYPEGSMYVDFDDKLERYARADRQGNITVRRVADDTEICRLPPGTGDGASLSRDGRFLWAGDPAKLWDVTGPEPRVIPVGESWGAAGAFSPDGRQFAHAQPDGSIGLYEVPSGRLRRRLGPRLFPKDLAFHPDGRQIALACQNFAQVRDLETEKVSVEFRYPAEAYPKIAWHPDGKTLATSFGGDQIIRLWDVASSKQIAKLEGWKGGGIIFTFNHAGDLLASNGWESTLRLWDPRTGQQLFQVRASHVAAGLRFSPDDRLLAADVKDGKIRLWEVAASRAYRTLVRDPALGKGRYYHCAVGPKGRLLAAGMGDGFGFWDCRTGAPLGCVPLPWAVPSVVFETSGALLTTGAGGTFRWPVRPDPAAPELLRIGPPQRLPLPDCSVLSCSPDGRVVAGGQFSGGLVWHRDRPGELFRLDHPDVRNVSVSPDGRWVATGSHSGTGAKVWDASTGRLVADLLPNQGLVGVHFQPGKDGKWLATTSQKGVCRLWAVDSWQEGPSHGATNGQVAFSPDGRLLAVETGQGVVRLLDPDTGREYARLEDPNQDRAAWSIAFSPDGTQLVVNGEGYSLHVWDLRAIRAELAQRGLDWDLPEFPPADPVPPRPLRIVVDRGDAGMSPEQKTAYWQGHVAINSIRLVSQPFDAEAALRRGWAFANLGQNSSAADDYALALTMLATSRPELFGDVPLWDIATQLNNWAWQWAMKPAPDQGRKALFAAQKAVELAPASWISRNTLGVVHYRLGQYAQACKELERSLDGSKGESAAFDLYFLAMCHRRLGEAAKARDCYDRAVRWVEEHNGKVAATSAKELQEFRREAEEVLELKKSPQK